MVSFQRRSNSATKYINNTHFFPSTGTQNKVRSVSNTKQHKRDNDSTHQSSHGTQPSPTYVLRKFRSNFITITTQLMYCFTCRGKATDRRAGEKHAIGKFARCKTSERWNAFYCTFKISRDKAYWKRCILWWTTDLEQIEVPDTAAVKRIHSVQLFQANKSFLDAAEKYEAELIRYARALRQQVTKQCTIGVSQFRGSLKIVLEKPRHAVSFPWDWCLFS